MRPDAEERLVRASMTVFFVAAGLLVAGKIGMEMAKSVLCPNETRVCAGGRCVVTCPATVRMVNE